MSEQYPLPSFAAHIWASAQGIHLCLPPTGAHEGRASGNFVVIPWKNLGLECGDSGTTLASQRGWEALKTILTERMAQPNVSIATKGAPVQYSLDAMLHAVRKFAPSGQRQIDYDELELGE